MHVKLHRSGPRTYLRLVQSYRESGHVKQRTIATLGRLDQIAPADVDALINGLLRATGRAEIKAEEQEIAADSAPELGPCWLLGSLWRELGLDEMLRQVLRSARRRFEAEARVRVMVFNRLCDADSKLGVLRWLEGVRLPGLESEVLTHQQLLRSLDALAERRHVLGGALARRLRPLVSGDLAVVFYDLTTLRVQGTGEVQGELRRYGMSKEVAGVARQCVLGLIQTREGIPLDHEVFEGNVAEVKTLEPMLERCLKRYPIRRVIAVADRGLLSLDNRAELDALRLHGRKLEYILAVPARRYTALGEALAKLNFEDKGESVRETDWDDHRLVVAHDPQRAREQRRRRRQRLDELLEQGERLAAKLDAQEAGHVGRGRRATDAGAYERFTRAVAEAELSRFLKAELHNERFSFYEDEAAVGAAERFDGKLVLVSNVTDLDAATVMARYKELADIERSFRVLKSDLEIAPLHHRLPQRIRAHASVCFLALLLQRIMRLRLRAVGSTLSPQRALQSVRTIQWYQVRVGPTQTCGVTPLTEQQRTIFKHLALPPPSDYRG